MSVVVIASGWGTSKGGENVFNTDWVESLTRAGDVRCFALEGTPEDVAAASAVGVRLSVLDCAQNEHADTIVQRIASAVGRDRPDWWVGHDVHTGTIASRCRVRHELSCVVHHMDYLSYKAFQGDFDVQARSDQQAAVLKDNDLIFAVGPRLARSAQGLARTGAVVELIPGLPSIDPLPFSVQFRVCISGRFSDRTEPLKQMRPVIAAFADAVKVGSIGVDAVLTIVGTTDIAEVAAFAEHRVGRLCNVIGQPYVTDRTRYFDLLRQQSLVVVPSAYEGFSLVGWEALAAGVPLLLSQNTGLADFLVREGLAPSDGVRLFDLAGTREPQPRDDDATAIATGMAALFSTGAAAKHAANRTRELLAARYTWERCGAMSLDALSSASMRRFRTCILTTGRRDQWIWLAAVVVRMEDASGLVEALDTLKRSQRFKADTALLQDDLGSISEEALSALLNAWASYSWDLDIGFVDAEAMPQLCSWVLGIALQRHHSSVSTLRCESQLQSDVTAALGTVSSRSPRFVAPSLERASSRLLRVTDSLCQRIVREVVFGASSAPWTAIVAPRLRSLSFPRKRKVVWRANAVDFAQMRTQD